MWQRQAIIEAFKIVSIDNEISKILSNRSSNETDLEPVPAEIEAEIKARARRLDEDVFVDTKLMTAIETAVHVALGSYGTDYCRKKVELEEAIDPCYIPGVDEDRA